MHPYEFHSLKLVETNPLVHKIGRHSLVLIAFFVLVLFLPWRQTVEGEGGIIAYDPTQRMQPISAPISGFIKEFSVSEDQHVTTGTKLFEMVDPDQTYKTRVYNIKADFINQEKNIQSEIALLNTKKESLLKQKEIGLTLYDKRLLQAQESLKSLNFRYEAEQQNRVVTQNNFERIKALYAQKIESRKNYEMSQNSAIKAKTQFDKIQVDIEVQKRQMTILEEEKKQFSEQITNQILTQENTILSAQTRLNVLKRAYEKHLIEISRFETSSVYAQKDGVVMRILENDKNSYITKGKPIVQFSPDVTTRAVLLKISDFNMPLIKEGLSVRLRFHGWPVLHIPGWPAIRFGTFGGIIKKVDPILHEPGIYYAYVVEDPNEPWPNSDVLRLGTNASAWIALSTVPIWYEIWRLLNAFPAKMVTGEVKK